MSVELGVLNTCFYSVHRKDIEYKTALYWIVCQFFYSWWNRNVMWGHYRTFTPFIGSQFDIVFDDNWRRFTMRTLVFDPQTKKNVYFYKLAAMPLSWFSDTSAWGQRFEPSYPSTTHPPNNRCTAAPFLYSTLTLLSSVPYVSWLTQVSHLKKKKLTTDTFTIIFKFIFTHKATRLRLRYTVNNNIYYEVKWAVYSVKFKFKHFVHP